MEQEEFIKELKKVAIEYFEKLEKKHKIYSFAIATDHDAMTIIIGYNTYDFFAESLKQSFLKHSIIADFNRWYVEEWKEGIGTEDRKIKILHDKMKYFENLEIHERLFLMYKALKEMKEEKVFANMKNDFILLLYQFDGFIDELMCQRMLELNDKKIFLEYLKDNEDVLTFSFAEKVYGRELIIGKIA